jgi:hypothetical protein
VSSLEPTPSSYRRGVLLVVLATCFFSLSGILVRLTEEASGWQIIFYRSLTLTGTMLILLAINYRHRMAEVIWSAGWNGSWPGPRPAVPWCSISWHCRRSRWPTRCSWWA